MFSNPSLDGIGPAWYAEGSVLEKLKLFSNSLM
jgi:hypothetical protein